MKLYKLTDQNGCTQNNTQWGEGVTHSVPVKENPKLCSKDVLHAYKNPNLALLINPIQANIEQPLLWEAKGKICVEDWEKVGCFKLTTTKRLPLPDWYTDTNTRYRVQVRFGVLCAEAVLHVYERYKPDDDRPRKVIEAAKQWLKTPYVYLSDVTRTAYAAARAAYAADAADAAARVADAAADAAAYAAARAADAAAYAAARAADAAAYAAAYAARAADNKINFGALADQAVKIEGKEGA